MRSSPRRARTIYLSSVPRPAHAEDEIVIVMDAAWTPSPNADPLESVRASIGRVLATYDPIATTTALLDDWAEATGIVPMLAVEGVSLWYLVRLRTWEWLQERAIWAAVVRDLFEELQPSAIACDSGLKPSLVDVTRLIAEADGLTVEVRERVADRGVPDHTPADLAASPAPRRRSRRSRGIGRLWRAVHRWSGRVGGEGRATSSGAGLGATAARRPSAWMDFVRGRVRTLGAGSGRRLLVVSHHVPQVVEAPDGQRQMNAYLGPVADRLRGSRLDPIMLDMTARRTDPAAVARVILPGHDRVLPAEALMLDEVPVDPAELAGVEAIADRISALRVPVIASGIDLGSALAREVGRGVAELLPGKLAAIHRIGRLLDRLPVSGILVADEYHRQDWMIAARARNLPVGAIQHGVIYRNHPGYGHRRRPSQLRLADRTYVFGRWERDVLVRDSVYRDDEVVVSGSPRLDIRTIQPVDRDAVRRELRVADGDRMVVLSGTHGAVGRTFQYPVALACLFDRPLPAVHLVVKLHPAEDDAGPYGAVIESVARAGGFAPPPMSVVRDIDLYRLLGAADAHLGIYSTVLTEAVLVGTSNLLANVSAGGDLLGYVDAGVALPVANGAQLLDALEAAANGAITDAARAAFVALHFEPGSASERIADDLLGWLS